MTVTREPSGTPARPSRQNIDELFAKAPTGADLATMDLDFFESDTELDEFLVWLREQRNADIA